MHSDHKEIQTPDQIKMAEVLHAPPRMNPLDFNDKRCSSAAAKTLDTDWAQVSNVSHIKLLVLIKPETQIKKCFQVGWYWCGRLFDLCFCDFWSCFGSFEFSLSASHSEYFCLQRSGSGLSFTLLSHFHKGSQTDVETRHPALCLQVKTGAMVGRLRGSSSSTTDCRTERHWCR